MGQTVNLLSYDFGGSNPPLPTQRQNQPDSMSGFFYAYFEKQQAGVAQLIEH